MTGRYISDLTSSSDKGKFSHRELICNARDAVVLVMGQIIMADRSLSTQMFGNGFFIKGHYIITTAELVMCSPNLIHRIPPYYPPGILKSESVEHMIIRVSKILVDISNVNGLGRSYSYEADIVGIDGAANIAVLKINADREWNRGNPKVGIGHLGITSSVKVGMHVPGILYL